MPLTGTPKDAPPMIKIILFVKRKPGMSREAFRDHYERVHAPLAQAKLGAWLVGYSRNYLVAVPGRSEPPCDCVTELCYRDRTTLEASVAWARSEEGQVLARDEENFMDRGALLTSMADTVATAL